jgi:hypothetical protein
MTSGPAEIDVNRALRNPRSLFEEPLDVVANARLATQDKLAILRAWEQDARSLSRSEGEGMGGGEESMLGRVEHAITLLVKSNLG